jgi:single-strand DNA-binding protein
MAAGFNRVILMGNLTQDPELRYTPQGTAVADLRLAVNNPRRRSDGQEDTVFVDVTVWDRQAETSCEYLSKGRAVLVEGRLRLDTWEDRQSGQKRSKLAVTAQNVQFLGGEGGSRGGGGGPRRGGGGGGGGRRQQDADYGGGGAQGGGEENLSEPFEGADDVPF